MSDYRLPWQSALATILCGVAIPLFPLVESGGAWHGMTILIAALAPAAIIADAGDARRDWRFAILALAPLIGVFLLMSQLSAGNGTARTSFFLMLAAFWLLGWRLVSVLSNDGKNVIGGKLGEFAVPVLFGLWI